MDHSMCMVYYHCNVCVLFRLNAHIVFTYTCIYHSQNWLCDPHAGGEPARGNKTGGPLAAGHQPCPHICIALSVHWVLIYGLARPMR